MVLDHICFPCQNSAHSSVDIKHLFVLILGGIGYSERPKHASPSTTNNEASFIDKEKKIPSDNHFTQELELAHLMLPVHKTTCVSLILSLLSSTKDDVFYPT